MAMLFVCGMATAMLSCSDKETETETEAIASEEETQQEVLSDTIRNSDFLYDINAMPEIMLTVSKKNWNKYLANYDQNPDNSEYVPVTFTFKKDGWLDNRMADGHLSDVEGNLWKGAWSQVLPGVWVGANFSDFNIYGTKAMGVNTDYKVYSYSLETNKKNGVEAAKTVCLQAMMPAPT